ncbi:MAG: hypothetical protein ABIF28_08685 [Pseudomonadota bacterium]
MRSDFAPNELQTPHVPLRISLPEGIEILRSTGYTATEETGAEHRFKVETPRFAVAIYAKDNEVGSVWYDDPTGRKTAPEKERKVELYLMRYGSLSNWELRMDNGWMHYWFNPIEKVAMVYGLHKDVIRFNQYHEEHA